MSQHIVLLCGSTGDQFPGAAHRAHSELPTHLQDAAPLRLVGRVRVAAHPVPAAASPGAQVLLGIQRSDSLHAADLNQLPAQPEVSDVTHPGAAEESGHLLHSGVSVPGVPGRVSQPRLGLLLPEAARPARASCQEDRPWYHAGPEDQAEDSAPVAVPVPRPPGGDAKASGPKQWEAASHVERGELRGAVGHPGTVLLLRSASRQLAVVVTWRSRHIPEESSSWFSHIVFISVWTKWTCPHRDAFRDTWLQIKLRLEL